MCRSLPTNRLGGDDTYVYYSAISPGLSVFAITSGIKIPALATFSVSDLTINPEQAGIGEPVTISVMVANTGELEGTYTVTLKINTTVEASENVTLTGGATKSVTFTISKDTDGTYDVEVDGLTGTFTVTKPPSAPTRWPLTAVIVVVVIIGIVLWLYMRRR